MTPAETNGYIQGFIQIDRKRARQRWQTALKYLGVAALILAGTGTVTLLPPSDTPHPPSSRVTVDLAHCPPLGPRSLPILTFTITMRGDGTPELQGCQRWEERPRRAR